MPDHYECTIALFVLFAVAGLTAPLAHAQNAGNQPLTLALEEIVVTATSRTYNNSVVTEQMTHQQTPLTSALAVIDNLPGVSIQEGNTFGFDDWSTTISVRGFQVSLDEQQIGITIDGIPNGNSNYGGGAKANRYIDTGNLLGVQVSQGTADIASKSNEALGGTLNFLTQGPDTAKRLRVVGTIGEFDSQRYYFRYDTGELFNSDTYAWISLSHQEATDWVNAVAENQRDHIAAKVTSTVSGEVDFAAYFSYDDTHEDNYQRLFSPADFAGNPEWDRLTAEWTGLPYVDQLYRPAWSTLRENLLAYLKADFIVSEDLALNTAAYTHHNYGRGDWVPPIWSTSPMTASAIPNPHS